MFGLMHVPNFNKIIILYTNLEPKLNKHIQIKDDIRCQCSTRIIRHGHNGQIRFYQGIKILIFAIR